MNKWEERNLEFTVFTGYHSFITLGKQFHDYNCKLFTLSRGGEQRGWCNQPTWLVLFPKCPWSTWPACLLAGRGNARGEEAHPESLCRATPNLPLLMPFGNRVQGIFSLCFDVSSERFISAEKSSFRSSPFQRDHSRLLHSFSGLSVLTPALSTHIHPLVFSVLSAQTGL